MLDGRTEGTQGDTVQVISGKDKGVKGKVIKTFPETQRIIVEGVNRVKRHTRLAAAGGARTGGIIARGVNPRLQCDGRRRRWKSPLVSRSVARQWTRTDQTEPRTPELVEFGYQCAAVRTSHDNRTRSPGSAAAQAALATMSCVLPCKQNSVSRMSLGTRTHQDRCQHGRRRGSSRPKLIDGAVRDLATITGQKPSVTRARKSIAQFKLREGQPIAHRRFAAIVMGVP